MNINCQLAINNLSFGFCSYNILYELYKRKINTNWFPIANNTDLSSFSRINPDFVNWLQNSVNNSLNNFKKQYPTFKLWHIQGSHEQIGTKQYLYTFSEMDSLTSTEVNILNQQEKIFVSCEESKIIFENSGVTVPVVYIPLGFDNNHFFNTNKKYYPENITCWLIAGKFEKRKSTGETIQAWIKKFGNNPNHMLHLAVTNPFFKPEDNQAILNQIFGGKKYFNINPLPYVKTLDEYNDILNCADIIIDMSRAETWSIPSFSSVALGKHAIIHNCLGVKSWANDKNAILVNPTGKIKATDGIFFHDMGNFNIGNFYNWDEKDLIDAFDKVLERKKQSKINIDGLKLQENFKWSHTVDMILKEMGVI